MQELIPQNTFFLSHLNRKNKFGNNLWSQKFLLFRYCNQGTLEKLPLISGFFEKLIYELILFWRLVANITFVSPTTHLKGHLLHVLRWPATFFGKGWSVLILYRSSQRNSVSALKVQKKPFEESKTDCKWELSAKIKISVRKWKFIRERSFVISGY